MLFKRRKQDFPTVVHDLASLGVKRHNGSCFLGNEAISEDLVLDFLKACETTERAFRFAEKVLLFACAFNALAVLLQLKDKALEAKILSILRQPSFFLKLHGLQEDPSRETLTLAVEKGYGLFIDNLELSERLIVIGANEVLASRFMNFLSDGRIGKEDDNTIWLIFSLGIYNHMKPLPQAIAKAKRKLGLP